MAMHVIIQIEMLQEFFTYVKNLYVVFLTVL